MDIGKSFTYPFEDKNWLSKLIIGALVSIVPILNFAWAGYVVDLVKNVMNKTDEPLPEWTEFGEKFMKGLYIFVAALVYALPVLCLLTVFAITTGTTITRIINYETWNTVETLFTGVGLVLSCLIVLYSILLSFFYPAMLLHFAQKETFGSLFEIGSIFRTATNNLSKYLVAWLIGIVAALLVGILVGMASAVLRFIPCFGRTLGIIVSGLAGVYLSTIWGHLFGQVGSESQSLVKVE